MDDPNDPGYPYYGSGDTTPRTDPNGGDPDNDEALNRITNNNTMDDSGKRKLGDALAILKGKCVYSEVYSFFVSHNLRFNFSYNSSLTTPAAYSYMNKTIYFQNNTTIEPDTFAEELYHAFQDYCYGGLGQYSNVGRSNIEFEAKLAADIMRVVSGQACCMTVDGSVDPGNEYYLWVLELTSDGSKMPTSWSSLESKYFFWLEKFKQSYPAYNTPTDKNLRPESMLNNFNLSACPK